MVVRGWGERGFKFTRARLNHGKVSKNISYLIFFGFERENMRSNSGKETFYLEQMNSTFIKT